ncbi:MAG TPA: hypothetical protein VGC95_07660 [Chitinophagaceae bacterium]|jgi:hypothetical protein
MKEQDIIQELNNLGSIPGNIYTVPAGYFERFPGSVLERIDGKRINETPDRVLPTATPYQVPVGYFDDLAERIMAHIRQHPDYQKCQEELAALSPMLSNLQKRPVYTVPEGYFENLTVAGAPAKGAAKVISLSSRKWIRYAAAAVVTGLIAVVGLLVYNNNSHSDPAGKTLARFEKEVKKIDDPKKTDSLIEMIDPGLNQQSLATNKGSLKTEDVQQLLQDVSTDELKDFNEQSKDIEDLMMTN